MALQEVSKISVIAVKNYVLKMSLESEYPHKFNVNFLCIEYT